MKFRLPYCLITLAMYSFLNLQTCVAAPPNTEFTYQGRLTDGVNPANGIYDLRFALFNDFAAGAQQGIILTNPATVVSNGLFTVTLDFGNQFPGADRWLEIGVRTNGGGAFSTLSPRQKLTPTPYAISAGNLSGVLSGTQIAAGTIGAAQINNAEVQVRVTGTAPAGQFITGVLANGTVTVASDTSDWKLGGNNVTAGQFLGSVNNQAVEIRANGARALRIEPNTSGAPNLIGGAALNSVASGVVGATISGGGATDYSTGTFFGSNPTNSVSANFGTVGGGSANSVEIGANNSAIAGGFGNNVQASAAYSFIGGGNANVLQTNLTAAVIGGGDQNLIQSQASFSTIGGGGVNSILSNAYESVISGGEANQIQASSHHSTIGGGSGNGIKTGSVASDIGGGQQNQINTNSSYAVISGGTSNSVASPFAAVGGGSRNTIMTSANYSYIAGGGD